MTEKLEVALDNVEMTYQELVEIANNYVEPVVHNANHLIDKLKDNNNLTIEQIRSNLLLLQMAAFELSEIKDKAALKANIAEAIQKEQFAIKFNQQSGAAAVKDKLATVANSEEITIEILFELIADLLKTKLDQLHRMVAVLTSILMSRMQEAKFMNLSSGSEVPATTFISQK